MIVDSSNLRTVDPVVYPVTIAEAKAHLRVDGSEEDYLIQGLIATATEHVESVLNFKISAQSWAMSFDVFPADNFYLPYTAESVTSVTYNDNDGVEQTISDTVYGLDLGRNLVYLKADQSWPDSRGEHNDVTVTFVASSPSRAARHAILMMVSELYENREDSVTGTIYTPTNVVVRLINQIRRPTPWQRW